MPLENKLPEPYASTWRQMLRDENGDKKQMASTSQSKASGAVKDASTPDSKNTLTVATLSISSSSTSTATLSSANITVNCVDSTNTLTKSHVKPSNAVVKLDESSDWLCDNCGNQNFATLANGMIRNRCFKCHSAKSANPTLVASVSNIKPSTATSVDSIKNESIVPVKATPIAVLDLKRDTSSRFISASEQRQQRSKGQQEARNKRAFFDALRRANKPDFIFLCSRLKRKLEAFLGSSGDLDNCALISGVATKSDVHIIYLPLPELLKRLESSIPDLGKNGSNSSTVPLSLFSQSAISLSIADQSKVLSVSVVSSLRSQEFGDDAISNALQFVFTSSSIRNKIISELHEQDEISAITTLSSQFADLVQESCLEYLCLYLNEEDLPESMDGRNFEAKPKLQLYKNPDTSSSSSSSMNGKLMKDKSPMIEEDMMETLTIGIQHSLTLFGCDSVTINAIDVVMSRINLSVASLPLNNMICSLALLSSFWQLYKAIPLSLTEVKVDECTNYFKLITTSQDQSLSPDVNLDIVTEEVSMLQAIFGEETCVYLFHNESVHEYRLCIDLNSISPSLFDIMSFIFGTKTAALASCNNLVLHLFIPKFLTYPTQPPIALLTIASNLNPSKDMLTSYNIDTDSMIPSIERRATLQLLQLEIQSKILEILMEPVMFTLAGFVKDDLGDSFKRKYYPTSSLNTLSGQSIFSNVTTFSSSLTSTSNEMTSNDSTLSVEEYLKKVFITFITTLSTVESAPTEILTTPADDDYAQIDDEDEDITTIASHSDNTSVANRNTHSVKKSMLRPQGRSFWDTALLRTPTLNTSASINTPERRKMAEIRKSLPAFKSRLQFLKTMSLGSCCIVTGETGCGTYTLCFIS